LRGARKYSVVVSYEASTFFKFTRNRPEKIEGKKNRKTRGSKLPTREARVVIFEGKKWDI
jgi:hypothetical protein